MSNQFVDPIADSTVLADLKWEKLETTGSETLEVYYIPEGEQSSADNTSKKIQAGKKVQMIYVGKTFEDRKTWGELEKFDASIDRPAKTFETPIGVGRVIKGWDVAVSTLNVGQAALLKCPPGYAYGQSAMGPIKANSTLCFAVRLIKML